MAQSGQNGETDAASGRQRVFINRFTVDVSLSEFAIDIGQSGPGDDTGKLYRFVTTPHHFQTIQRTINNAAGKYLAKFGPIPRYGNGDGGSDG